MSADTQQLQVPVRRISIPADLKGSSHETEQKTVSQTPYDRVCPQCLAKRLILHYMSLGCNPVIKGGCQCPSRYDCPSGDKLTRANCML